MLSGWIRYRFWKIFGSSETKAKIKVLEEEYDEEQIKVVKSEYEIEFCKTQEPLNRYFIRTLEGDRVHGLVNIAKIYNTNTKTNTAQKPWEM